MPAIPGNETSSVIGDLATYTAKGLLQLMQQHGWVVSVLAIIGGFAIFTAIVNEAFKALKYLFMMFIAFPLILLLGLVNRNLRKQRLRELGEIRAYVKQHPDRWVRIVYFTILCLFILFLCFVGYFFFYKFVVPIINMNEMTKHLVTPNITTTNST